MRTITAHRCNDVNDGLEVTAMDAPGPGGAHHYYRIEHENPDPRRAFIRGIVFQKGTIAEEGVNGITNEILLALVIDRLQCFQAGPFGCIENQAALEAAREALDWLKKRTEGRIARGVEGTYKT